MNIVASDAAIRYVAERGGKVFVKAGLACCGGTRYIECSTKEPADRYGFEEFHFGGVAIFVRAAATKLPNDLALEVRGRLRPSIRASWNGCAFII